MVSVLALIPARAGSKRVPRKNVRNLGGQPLIEWSIRTALASQLIDHIIVSSDDAIALKIAQDYDLEPVPRAPELAGDDASIYDVIRNILGHLDEHFDYLVLLQPTSPFRDPRDIDQCIDICEAGGWPAVISRETGKTVPNGSIYVGRTDWLLDGGHFDSDMPVGFDMDALRSIDIDTPEDWARAEQVCAGIVNDEVSA